MIIFAIPFHTLDHIIICKFDDLNYSSLVLAPCVPGFLTRSRHGLAISKLIILELVYNISFDNLVSEGRETTH